MTVSVKFYLCSQRFEFLHNICLLLKPCVSESLDFPENSKNVLELIFNAGRHGF